MEDQGVLITEALMLEISPIGVLAGLISSGRATKANIRIVDNLIKAKKNCPDKDCEETVDRQIRNYKMKIGDKNWSSIRRAIGGGLTTSIGSLAYHYYDKRKKIKGINNTASSALNKALEKCKDRPYGEKGKCEEQVRAKYAKFMGSMKGKEVYRKEV